MKLLLDSASPIEIRECLEKKLVAGVVLTPTSLLKNNLTAAEAMEHFLKSYDTSTNPSLFIPIDGETPEVMLEKAKNYLDWAKSILNNKYIYPTTFIRVSLPMTENGLKAASLIRKTGIMTNLDFVSSLSQCILAESTGNEFLTIFVNEICQYSYNRNQEAAALLIEKIKKITKKAIIATSISNLVQVESAALAGADYCAVSYNILKVMFFSSITEDGLKKFKEAQSSLENSKSF